MMDHQDEILQRQFVMTDTGRVDRIIDLYTTYNNEVDLQAMKEKGYIEAVGKMMEPVTISFNDHDPMVIAYWAKLGMVKEFHGENSPMSWTEYEMKTGFHWEDSEHQGPQNFRRQWTSFVPCEAFDDGGRKSFPTVIALHGGFNPKSIIDGWGFVQEAAKRRWIVLVPSLELSDLVEEMLNEAAEMYPIDRSRVYITGFSYGGFMSDRNALERPDLFAAAGPCGAPIGANDLRQMRYSPEPMRPLDWNHTALSEEMLMPVINCYGNLDGNRFPFYDCDENNTMEELLEGINLWCDINHAPRVRKEEILALKGRENISEEEKNIGLPLAPEYRRTVCADGITNYIGDIPSEDGIVRIRIMCEMNMPHWPTPEMIRQLYDFFSHFSRNTLTGESIYSA